MDYLEKQRLILDREEQGKALFNCDRCGTVIYDGDEYYTTQGECFCEECFDELLDDEKFEARRIAGEDDDY